MANAALSVPVGGGATCPRCLHSDTTQRVSLIVHLVSGDISPAEYDHLSVALSRGEARNWSSPHTASSWDELAKQLALPEKPELSPIAKLSSTSLRYFSIAWLFAGSVLFFLLLDYAPVPTGCAGVLSCLILFFPLIVAWRWSVFMVKSNIEIEKKVSNWGVAKSKWHQLYYCARDNCVFVPGQQRVIEPKDVRAFLHEH